jgi:hypothetical protein
VLTEGGGWIKPKFVPVGIMVNINVKFALELAVKAQKGSTLFF